MSLTFVGFWRNVKVWRQNMRKTMSTCDKSFTRSDSSKVSSLKLEIHTDTEWFHQWKSGIYHSLGCICCHATIFWQTLLRCSLWQRARVKSLRRCWLRRTWERWAWAARVSRSPTCWWKEPPYWRGWRLLKWDLRVAAFQRRRTRSR